jgi:uncharacterized protein YbbC (DUF1343 family)
MGQFDRCRADSGKIGAFRRETGNQLKSLFVLLNNPHFCSMRKVWFFIILIVLLTEGCKQSAKLATNEVHSSSPARPGAHQVNTYLPFLIGKRVGIFANQTSMVGNRHLVDTLRKLGVQIEVIFGPEHGFRGKADAGEKVANYVDAETGIPVVSLYGSKRLPDENDLKNVDILLFDIQDVGTRFYTYISSLEDFMEAAIKFRKPLVILDRPNPNGHYVDGPVLEAPYKSFVGKQEIPIVYGMTIGEYANYLVGEKLVAGISDKYIPVVVDMQLVQAYPRQPHIEVHVIRCVNYNHQTVYDLPVKPSPNLPNLQSILLYPSTCLFEGTVLSEGRGTDKPFQVFGHPSLPNNLYAFTPSPNEGAKSSKHYGKVCYGWDLSGTVDEVRSEVNNRIQLKWLMEAYRLFPQKDSFFLLPKNGQMEASFFNKLAGNNQLWQQIKNGESETAIRKSWEPALSAFKKKRKKYLLYSE